MNTPQPQADAEFDEAAANALNGFFEFTELVDGQHPAGIMGDYPDYDMTLAAIHAAADKLVEARVAEARKDELDMVDQAFSWGSIETHEGFKLWRQNRLRKLAEPMPTEEAKPAAEGGTE